MESFDERVKKYREISEKTINELINFGNPALNSVLDVLISHDNELLLRYAEDFMLYYNNMRLLLVLVQCGIAKEIPYEENTSAKIFFDACVMLMNNEDMPEASLFWEEERAKYGEGMEPLEFSVQTLISGFLMNKKEEHIKMLQNLGLNFENPDDVEKFNLLYARVSSYLAPLIYNNIVSRDSINEEFLSDYETIILNFYEYLRPAAILKLRNIQNSMAYDLLALKIGYYDTQYILERIKNSKERKLS